MIFTLDARDIVFLPVIAEYLNLTDAQCKDMILSGVSALEDKLKGKGIEYAALKPALIPVHKDRRETAFIFDSRLIEESWYARPIFHALLPALNKESTYSILGGDILARKLPPHVSAAILFENLVQVHPTTFVSPDQYYVIYINNLSNAQHEEIIAALSTKAFFVGYADMTFSSDLKLLLACSLVHIGIKYRNIFLLPHEEDRDDAEDVNISCLPFERYGFTVKSINGLLYGLFLSYKIETYAADPEDLKYSLIAVQSGAAANFQLPVSVVSEKLLYLKEKKAGLIQKLGLQDYSEDDLANLIRLRMAGSYFYNLEYLEEYDVPKFNISLELRTASVAMRKVIVALKYVPAKKTLELITMY